jgi:hypothetical protein
LVDELHHPFPQIQCIGFHAQKPIRLCANVNMKCYKLLVACWLTKLCRICDKVLSCIFIAN